MILINNNLLSGSNCKTFWVSFYKIQIFSTPMKNFKWGIEFEKQRFPCTIEMVWHMKWTWCQRSKNLKTDKNNMLYISANIISIDVKLTLFSVSSITMSIGLSSLCIFRYKVFKENPFWEVLNTNDQEYPSALQIV